ncbi:MAG: flagellar biosynthesis protein FlhF, partial [Lachnospiraceae bacterium]
MIVKKFTGATETEAVLAAKEELGSNAVVLNVKTLKQRGIFRLFKKDKVEITAALEEKEFVKDEIHKPAGFSKAAGSEADDEKVQTAIEEKLDSLHVLLKNQMEKEKSMAVKLERTLEEEQAAGREEHSDNFKFLQLIYNKLIDNEVDEKYANSIIGDIEGSLKKESNIDSLLAGVYQKIILKLGKPETIKLGDKPKVVFFIGPTGVGKTTTIAKLASKFKLEEKAKVAFITADTYRIAAVEQLNTYASIIDCPVSVIYDPSELEGALNGFADYNLIMVDTAGR